MRCKRVKTKSVAVQTVETFFQRPLEQIKRKRPRKQRRIKDPPGPEFPGITAKMKVIIEKTLKGDPQEHICRSIYRSDIQKLQRQEWLNDVVIDAYFDMIVERSMKEGYPSVYAYNTCFYTIFKIRGYVDRIRRWTQTIDIFNYDLNFVPIETGFSSGSLGVIDHRLKKIYYYDSGMKTQEDCKYLLLEYLRMEHEFKKGVPLEPYSYEKKTMRKIPLQKNGHDGAMFVLKYAEYISRNAELTFKQNDMPFFRQRMIYELVTNEIIYE